MLSLLLIPLFVPFAAAFAGRATWFEIGLGACGNWNNNNEAVVALAEKVWVTKPDGGNPNNSPWCGKEITICLGPVCHDATIVDLCPVSGGCAYSDGDALDLSPSLFQSFASLDQGIFQMTWSLKGDAPDVTVDDTSDADQAAAAAKKKAQQEAEQAKQEAQEQAAQEEAAARQAAADARASKSAAAAYRASIASEASAASEASVASVVSVASVRSVRSARHASRISRSSRLAAIASRSVAQSRALLALPTTTSSPAISNLPSDLTQNLVSQLPAETGSAKSKSKAKAKVATLDPDQKVTMVNGAKSSIQALTLVVLNLANLASKLVSSTTN